MHAIALCLVLAFPVALVAADPQPPIDWDRARQLHQRAQRGEKLSPEDQAYYDRARAEFPRRSAGAATTQPAPAASVGLPPLTDGAGAEYRGQTLGLYGDGANTPPEQHLRKATEAAAAITPLSADGKPAADGRIVLMSVGMSNTTQEFSQFVALAKDEAARNPRLSIVDGAQGGKAAPDWSAAGRMQTWEEAKHRLEVAGVTPQQVQVIWLKQAMISPAQYGAFPAHAQRLEEHLKGIVLVAREQFPNLKLIYLSSRTYGGWATTGLNPEPYAYESAFSVQWLIRSQMAGTDPDLAYGKAPVLLWGPYLWTDGTKGRKDGTVWEQGDTGPDGTHPGRSGREKVAQMLLEFFKGDPTTRKWFTSGK